MVRPEMLGEPSQVLALAWGSRSMTRTCSPVAASWTAVVTTVVVFPTLPDRLATV
jgi:hypothetical protein